MPLYHANVVEDLRTMKKSSDWDPLDAECLKILADERAAAPFETTKSAIVRTALRLLKRGTAIRSRMRDQDHHRIHLQPPGLETGRGFCGQLKMP